MKQGLTPSMKRSQGVLPLFLLVSMAILAFPSDALWLRDIDLIRWRLGLPWLKPPRVATNKPEITKCWASLRHTRGCMASIFKSYIHGTSYLRYDCCEAVQGLEEHCFHKLFSSFPFNQEFPSLMKRFCASRRAASPGPAPTLNQIHLY